MKKTITLVLALYCCCTTMAQSASIHSIAVNDIDGASINLSSYQGSKLLICIAPNNIEDSNRIKEIGALLQQYGSQIKLIGVMSLENGYIDSNKAAIKAAYSSRGIDIKLTTGMNTKKSAGNNQSAIMQWLTTKTMNGRFNIDAKGIGQKFFIDKNGKLFEIVAPEAPYDSDIVKATINRKN